MSVNAKKHTKQVHKKHDCLHIEHILNVYCIFDKISLHSNKAILIVRIEFRRGMEQPGSSSGS